jgi:hypothetical protein
MGKLDIDDHTRKIYSYYIVHQKTRKASLFVDIFNLPASFVRLVGTVIANFLNDVAVYGLHECQIQRL